MTYVFPQARRAACDEQAKKEAEAAAAAAAAAAAVIPAAAAINTPAVVPGDDGVQDPVTGEISPRIKQVCNDAYNLNPVLRENILASDYFKALV